MLRWTQLRGQPAMHLSLDSRESVGIRSDAAFRWLAQRPASLALILLVQLLWPGYGFPQDQRPTYPVSGVVENSLTHQPIARALVESPQAEAVFTDNEGRFELHLPEGQTTVFARRPGYADQGRGTGNQQLITVSEDMSPITLSLTPEATVSGQIALDGGDDPTGIQLMLYEKVISEGRGHWQQIGSVPPRSDGSFETILHDAPGSYILCTAPSPDHLGPALPGVPVWGYVPACFPGGADVASAMAAPLKVSAGQQLQLEIALERQPFFPVSIAVANSGAGNNGNLQVYDSSGRQAGFGVRRRDQGYEVNLPNGRYYAESESWAQNIYSYGRTDFTVAGAPLSGIQVVAVPLQPVTVEVREEMTATATPGDRPNVELGDQPPFGIELTPLDDLLSPQMGVSVSHPPGSPDGVYQLGLRRTGTFRLDIRDFAQVYAASVSSGSSDLTKEPLVIGPGGSCPPIEVTLRNDFGYLRGTPKDDSQPAPDGSAAALTQFHPRLPPIRFPIISLARHRIYTGFADLPTIAGSSMGGHYGSVSLPPGDYLVLPFAVNPQTSQQIDLDDQEAMSRLASRGQTVTIQPGATVEVEIDRAPADEGSGQ